MTFINAIQRRLYREWRNEKEFLDGYLRNITGIIHVGANIGQEREFYRLFGLDVIWIDPIDEVYNTLVDNLADFPYQRAIKALLTDKHGVEYDFKIANNNGASSSIFPFDKHAELWPEIQYSETRKIVSTTLKQLMLRERLSPNIYQALSMDVEGAELLVLKGGGDLIEKFKYVKAEVADFTPRTGSPVTSDLSDFLACQGFEELVRRPFAQGPGGVGTYWDIVWRKKPLLRALHRPAGTTTPVIAQDVSGVGWDKVSNS